MARLRLEAEGGTFLLELRDCATTRALVAALPFESSAQTWGEELYFYTPVSASLEEGAQQVVDPGAVCFWTEGDALALPWGRTPISEDGRPKLANPCSVLGKVIGDPKDLAKICPGCLVRVTAA